MNNLIKIIAIVLILSSCNTNYSKLHDGDLLFCVAENSVMSNAIVDATRTEMDVQYDHVAIYTLVENIPSVIEANPKEGVVCRSLEAFLDDATSINGGKGVVVMRLTESINIEDAIERAHQFIGQPYDWSYLPNNNRFYCSELIYECYRNDDGTPLFEAKPMTFKDKDGDIPTFWLELFRNNGEPIPEGVLGTNPNDMVLDPSLEEVYSYY